MTSAQEKDALSCLTPKQRAFVLEYAQHRNGVAAARAAGYKGSDNTMAVRASELGSVNKIEAEAL